MNMFTGNLQALLKEGGKYFEGIHEVTLKNIDACKMVTGITATSLGPNGMNKLIVNHLEKHLITSNTSVIMKELEVEHPAVKLLIGAMEMQRHDYGDCCNFLLTFSGDLLTNAESLIKSGLHTADIIRGYELSVGYILPLLKESVSYTVSDIRNPQELVRIFRSTIQCSRLFGETEDFAKQIAEAAVSVMPANPIYFDPDNIRVVKILGASMAKMQKINGMVVSREPQSKRQEAINCKVMVLQCGLEITSTETKATVLLTSATELLNFSRDEEKQMNERIKAIRDVGVEMIIVNGTVSDLALHFCDLYEIIVLKVQSKFDIQRICKTLGATPLVRMGVPIADDLGTAESVKVEELGSKRITIIKAANSKVVTFILRANTNNYLDEIERSINDCLNRIRAAARDPRFVAGGGAIEIELAQKLQTYGASLSGLDQYAVERFGEAFECVPRTLAENSGQDSMKLLTLLYAAHQKGRPNECVDIKGKNGKTADALESEIFDHLMSKSSAITLAVDAVLTILRIDHIIIARPAGGPNPSRAAGAASLEDD